MTLIIVVLLGTGALLIISALENQSIAQTFQDILAGKDISSKVSGSSGAAGGGSSSAG